MYSKFLFRIATIICLAVSLCQLNAHAAEADIAHENPKIYAYSLRNRLTSSGTSEYNALLDYLKDSGLSFNVVIGSLPRSTRRFKTDTKSCLFPAALKPLLIAEPDLKAASLISSLPIDTVKLRVFTKNGKVPVKNAKGLSKMKVAYWAGLKVDDVLPDIEFIKTPAPNTAVQLRMLEAGRVDAVLGFSPDVELTAKKLGVATPEYDANLALISEKASFICYENDQSKIFVAALNERLKDRKNLKTLFGEYVTIE